MERFSSATASVIALAMAGAAQAQVAVPPTTAAEPPVVSTGPGLLDGFRDPPNVARPRTWWHWMNGNVTEEGIAADLAWMERAGIGGAHFFDAGGGLASLRFVEPRRLFGDPNWSRAVHLAASTAARSGMELATAASPGWSETGGPWVTPAQAQKKYVWSERLVEGGRPVAGPLPLPPRRTGPFQDVAAAPDPALPPVTQEFYADAMVVAYRLPAAERRQVAPVRIATASGDLDPAPLGDGRLDKGQMVSGAATDAFAWVRADFGRKVTVRGLSLGLPRIAVGEEAPPILETSDDGVRWRSGATLRGPTDALLKTYGFAPLTARYFRLRLARAAPPPGMAGAPAPRTPSGPPTLPLTEFVLHGAGLVDRFVEKAGFTEPVAYDAAPSAATDPAGAIPRGDVVDLTGRLRPDGTLDWTPPRGTWRILRFGYSLTGQRNGPAPVEETGLEVDKFSPVHIKAYLDTYLGHLGTAAGPGLMGGSGLRYLLSDSWEAGVQNWTDDMPRLFRERRGYDLAPWLPVLTGRVVGSAEASDRFLWDWRRTLQDLLAQHYALIRDELHRRGMGFYAEAQGDSWRAIADGMEIKSRADIPMAEYWYEPFFAGPGQAALKADMKEAASVAHLYGKPLVANESLTIFAPNRPWSVSPAMMKPVIDEILAYGVNRIVLHTSVHQPVDRAPGLSLGPFGQFVGRLDTWGEQARPLFDYVARASWLLQQGRDTADVAYFYGEQRPLVSLFKGEHAYDAANDRLAIEVPAGVGYDFINAETLREAATVEGGRLRSAGGAAYRVLFVPDHVEAMTPALLERLAALVEGGLVLAGPKPRRPLGLGGDARRFDTIAARLWGDGTAGERAVGKGRVYVGRTLADVLVAERVAPDVRFSQGGASVLHLHRATSDGTDIYYLVNRGAATRTEASFRVSGKVPELWRADTGATQRLSYRVEGDRIVVPLSLEQRDSAFVVFRPGRPETRFDMATVRQRPVATVTGPWAVTFQPGRGAPAGTTMPTLTAWNDAAVDGIRHFSGTAEYRTTLTLPAGTSGGRLLLDLGAVRDLARVTVNGKPLGILWKAPFTIDATAALKPGRNDLRIAVTNLWANRLIGDAAARRRGEPTIGWTAANLPRDQQGKGFSASWSATAPLLPSGLLGPVRVLAEDR